MIIVLPRSPSKQTAWGYEGSSGDGAIGPRKTEKSVGTNTHRPPPPPQHTRTNILLEVLNQMNATFCHMIPSWCIAVNLINKMYYTTIIGYYFPRLTAYVYTNICSMFYFCHEVYSNFYLCVCFFEDSKMFSK